MKKIKVAFLVYNPLRNRGRKNNSFLGRGNIGAQMVEDVLKRRGIEVGRCSPETAHKYRLVLVSLTSTYDVLSYYQQVALRPDWQRGYRKFVVMAGGFGMQNPTTIRNYIDYAAFGRVEDWIGDVVDDILGGKTPQHESLMHLPEIHNVVISQAKKLYPSPIGDYSEKFIGCPNKCKFCHYTWVRKKMGGSDPYEFDGDAYTGNTATERTWDKLFDLRKKHGRIRTAIDGFSERLRYGYGKKISNKDIVEGIEWVGQWDGITVLLVYNIANMPTEVEGDRQELYDCLNTVSPNNRVVFVLQSTPFRPSLATPMQWEEVNLFPDWSKLRYQVFVDKPEFYATHSFTLETPFSHLKTMVIERATPETDKLFHALAFANVFKRVKASTSVKIIEKEFDINPYIRQYEFGEIHPAWFLHSYTDHDVLVNIATRMRKQMHKTKNPGG